MQNSKYNIWQDENGWRGYLDGYPQHEAQGESFQDLEVALWQLHQHLTRAERQLFEQPPSDSSWIDEIVTNSEVSSVEASEDTPPERSASGSEYSEVTPPSAAVFRSKSRVQIKRRARVELLMLVMVTSLNST